MLMAGYLVMATGMAIGAIAGHGVALLGFSLAAFKTASSFVTWWRGIILLPYC